LAGYNLLVLLNAYFGKPTFYDFITNSLHALKIAPLLEQLLRQGLYLEPTNLSNADNFAKNHGNYQRAKNIGHQGY